MWPENVIRNCDPYATTSGARIPAGGTPAASAPTAGAETTVSGWDVHKYGYHISRLSWLLIVWRRFFAIYSTYLFHHPWAEMYKNNPATVFGSITRSRAYVSNNLLQLEELNWWSKTSCFFFPAAVCSCPSGTVGDPLVACRESRRQTSRQVNNLIWATLDNLQ